MSNRKNDESGGAWKSSGRAEDGEHRMLFCMSLLASVARYISYLPCSSGSTKTVSSSRPGVGQ